MLGKYKENGVRSQNIDEEREKEVLKLGTYYNSNKINNGTITYTVKLWIKIQDVITLHKI